MEKNMSAVQDFQQVQDFAPEEEAAIDQNEEQPDKKEEKTFTQEELNTILQRRLAEEKEKAAREADRKLAMSLADREQELREREAQVARREAEASAKKMLLKKGMSEKLSDFLDYSSPESMKASMHALEAVHKESVQAGVEARFRHMGYEPRGSGIGKIGIDSSLLNDKEDEFISALRHGAGGGFSSKGV